MSIHDLITAHELKALVVDDDPIMLKLASAMLKEFGYRVQTAVGGTEALLDLSRAPCDLVLTDYMMPVINGYQLGHKIKSRYPGTRVVIMTGLGRAEVTGMMSDGSVDGWLFKPFNPDKLKIQLERIGLPVKGAA